MTAPTLSFVYTLFRCLCGDSQPSWTFHIYSMCVFSLCWARWKTASLRFCVFWQIMIFNRFVPNIQIWQDWEMLLSTFLSLRHPLHSLSVFQWDYGGLQQSTECVCVKRRQSFLTQDKCVMNLWHFLAAQKFPCVIWSSACSVSRSTHRHSWAKMNPSH